MILNPAGRAGLPDGNALAQTQTFSTIPVMQSAKSKGGSYRRGQSQWSVYSFKTFITLRRCDQSLIAFTRIELVAVLASVSLLVAVLIAPALASNKSDSERLVCFNNLRLIGRAVQMWAGDHNGNPPWRTLVSDGGTFPQAGTKPGLAWYEFSVLSNELATPKILACPADAAIPARDFLTFNTGPFQGNALSYVIGLETVADAPRSWLSGDYNLRRDSNRVSCSARVNNADGIATYVLPFVPSTNSPLAWTNGVVHGEFGHILLMDGSVEFTSSLRLRAVLLPQQADDNGGTHFLRPR